MDVDAVEYQGATYHGEDVGSISLEVERSV